MTGGRQVVVLAARPRRVAALGLPAHDEVVLVTATTPADVHAELRLRPRTDVVVDTRAGNPQRQLRRWQALFPHLQPGGHWIVLRGGSERDVVLDELTRLAAEAAAADRDDDAATGLGRRWLEPARAIDDIVATEESVTVVKRGRHLLKVRDAEVPLVLAARTPELRVTELESLRDGVLHMHPGSSSHGSDHLDLTAPLRYPAAHLRRYDGAVDVIEGSVVRHGDTLLPDTYRWHLQDVPVNKRLVDLDADFARTRRDETVGAHLAGAYYHLDYKNPGHYGHLVTEAVSRLWGWEAAKRDDPGLRLLLRRSPDGGRRRRPRPETVLLPALGIDADDVAWVEGSAWVDHLVGVTPLWHNKEPYSAHPHVASTWTRLREGLPRVEVATAPRIFVTRDATGHRACHDLVEVEAFFADAGFVVVHPGALSIPEQAALFAQARVVAGFGGTGMFNLAFARDLERVIVLAHTAYDARNEQLMAAVHGVPVHYFWSDPEVQHPPGGFSYEAFQSPWTFELDRHRSALRASLA